MSQTRVPELSTHLPDPLHDDIANLWNNDLSPDLKYLIQDNKNNSASLLRVCALSQFVRAYVIKQPNIIIELINSGDIQKNLYKQDYIALLKEASPRISDETTLIVELRLLRQREFIRIAWRDLMGWADLSEVTQSLTEFADCIMAFTLNHLHTWLCEKMGTPRDAKQREQRMMIVALGKLGGEELNFSSDIDLVFVYPEQGETDRSINNREYFRSLAQACIRVLNSPTELGIVFRVDMRLRPFGDAGPLSVSLSQLRSYFTENGREWERYAYVKARVICGDLPDVEILNNIIKKFVYHRYLDYGTIDSLRAMKKLIDREIIIKKLQNDIKRGPGGIRQIEFIVQTYQLIHGGSDLKLQQQRLLPVLEELVVKGSINKEIGLKLSQSYCYLRNLEHRIQMYKDQQSHTLPLDQLQQLCLACSMGCMDWQTLLEESNQHREFVLQQYEHLLDKPKHSNAGLGDYCSIEVNKQWQGEFNEDILLPLLEEMQITPSDQAYKLLAQFRNSGLLGDLSKRALERINALMPIFLPLLSQVVNPVVTLERCLVLFDRCLKQTAYISMLLEKPVAMERLVRLFSQSSWIAEMVADHPFLLDQFIVAKTLTAPKSEQQLEDTLRQLLLSIPEDNLNEQLELLRSFKLRQMIQVAVADIENTLPIMKVSDHLTFTATVIIRQVYHLALKEFLNQAPIESQYQEQDIALAIIAYGKMGGIELSYESDLDLVFLHQSEARHVPIVIRLVQRIIQMCTTHMSNGILYPIDTRLRPSGDAGLLATSVSAFENYQAHEAWTWEHQAIVRARVISANEQIAEKFTQIRRHALCMVRDKNELKDKILDMRNKMLAENPQKMAKEKDSITDIEFIVQFTVLAWANQFNELSDWTDNVRILEALDKVQIISSAQVEVLTNAYKAFRYAVHHNHLKLALPGEMQQKIAFYQQQIARLWKDTFVR